MQQQQQQQQQQQPGSFGNPGMPLMAPNTKAISVEQLEWELAAGGGALGGGAPGYTQHPHSMGGDPYAGLQQPPIPQGAPPQQDLESSLKSMLNISPQDVNRMSDIVPGGGLLDGLGGVEVNAMQEADQGEVSWLAVLSSRICPLPHFRFCRVTEE
jgi:hypothetical protein